MKRLVYLLLLIACGMQAQIDGSPTSLNNGLKLPNAINSITIDSIPLIDGDGVVNAYITKAQLQSDIGTSIPNGTGFLKNDGIGTWSYDNNTYAVDSTVVHKTGNEFITDIKTFNTISNTINIISHNTLTGSGIISDNGSTGIGFESINGSSGNGIVSNGSTASTGFVYVGQNNGANTFTVKKEGYVTANSFIKTGGTASQFLKADGSVDSSTYLTSFTETDPTVPTYTKGLTSATTLLNEIKTVDGAGSGLDADLLDGVNSTQFLRNDTSNTTNGVIVFNDDVTLRFGNNNDFRILHGSDTHTYFQMFNEGNMIWRDVDAGVNRFTFGRTTGNFTNTGTITSQGTGNSSFAGDVTVPDEVYGTGWNGSLEVPTKNAVYDKIETLGSLISESSGTWTPSLTDASATFSVSASSGAYYKIGKLVHIRGVINISSTSGTPTDLFITGIPFVFLNNSGIEILIFKGASTVPTNLSGFGIDGTSNVEFKNLTLNTKISPSFTNGLIEITATYITN